MNDIIPQQPGAAYADQSAAIIDSAANIGAYLALWSMRDDSKPDAPARRAANEAMDAIDRALRQLHALRERLVGDIRASDDATADRVDALLASRAAERDTSRSARPALTGPCATGGPHMPCSVPFLCGCVCHVTADENGEHPGAVEQAAGSLPWTLSGDGKWRATLPDGRAAVIERLADSDESGTGAAFLPRVHESAQDYVDGPVCAGLLGAAAWVWEYAGIG